MSTYVAIVEIDDPDEQWEPDELRKEIRGALDGLYQPGLLTFQVTVRSGLSVRSDEEDPSGHQEHEAARGQYSASGVPTMSDRVDKSSGSVYPKPPYVGKWWETPLFWPADVAVWLGGIFRWHLGSWWLHQRTAQAAFWVVEKLHPEGRQTGRACPCCYSPDLAPMTYGGDPDPSCDICFGSGSIWLDWEGNVIGNADEDAAERTNSGPRLSERQVRHWVSYWLGDHSEAKIDEMVETMPEDVEVARWLNEQMGWSYGR